MHLTKKYIIKHVVLKLWCVDLWWYMDFSFLYSWGHFAGLLF